MNILLGYIYQLSTIRLLLQSVTCSFPLLAAIPSHEKERPQKSKFLFADTTKSGRGLL